MSRIESFIIKSTRIHQDWHGKFTCHIILKTALCEMVFGGFSLDEYYPVEDRRVGVGSGIEFLKNIISTVGSADWESLAGMQSGS